MIDHIWSVLCSRSTIDTESNNVSLFNVIEQINPVGLPEGARGLLPMEVEIVSLWVRDDVPGRGFTRVVIETPSSSVEPSAEGMIDLSSETIKRFRTRQRLLGVPFEGHGQYWFRVEFRTEEATEWITVARIPVEMAHVVE